MSPKDRGSLVSSALPTPTVRDNRSETGARICIASIEINGPSRNGGIGTAYTTLAEKLTRTGHDVTILYLLGKLTERQPVDAWVADFHRRGIRFVPLDPGEVPLCGSRSLQLSYLAYRWLAGQEAAGNRFDVIHFHEWLGLGYYSLLARHQGLALTGPTICVGLHSPTMWLVEANQGLLDDPDQLECDALERRCAELADVVWAPSRYLLDWVTRHGWDVEGRAWVHPNPVPHFETGHPHSDQPVPVHQAVFFGRLEVRKGLVLFCDALDRLEAGDVPSSFRVVFLGKPCLIDGVDALTYLRRRSSRWRFPIDILTDHDHAEAMLHISRPGRLVVMPSLVENCPLVVIECLSLGVPFLASAVGGIPELIASECHEEVLFSPAPEALARRLREALCAGARPARAAVDAEECDHTWDQWHHRQHRAATAPRERAAVPLVSACTSDPASIASLQIQQGLSIEIVTDASHAHGKYVLLVGAQVTLLAGAVRRLVEVAEVTKADLVTSLEDVHDTLTHLPVFRRLWAGLESMLGLVRNCFGGPCVLIRREALARLDCSAALAAPSRELLARAVLHGLRLEVIPDVLFATPIEQSAMARELSACLNPYLEEVPDAYRDLLRLTQGQALRVERLEQGLARVRAFKPLRYRMADLLHGCLGRVPLVRSVFRWLLGKLFRS